MKQVFENLKNGKIIRFRLNDEVQVAKVRTIESEETRFLNCCNRLQKKE